ncbi:hypothetical protein OPT61_g1051 [Boeremia exigua]|uniref:Uncharacterized protein n=1 Tax=Boeremia exigua TaxID=749465 RepID=A0ACC2IRQ0_9PLEO|nr:hypothetical protein OPT61_g1051 [Boeremia exigua]
MFLDTRYLALASIASTLVNSLPLGTTQPRDVVPRAKSYSVINVDGGAATKAPAEATTTVEQTVKSTVTAEVTATVVEPAPVSAAPSTSSSTPRPSSSTPTSTRTTQTASTTQTPKPVFVTVTVTEDGGPTEYYDDGMWHTSYRIKTFEAIATSSLLLTLSAINPGATGVSAW